MTEKEIIRWLGFRPGDKPFNRKLRPEIVHGMVHLSNPHTANEHYRTFRRFLQVAPIPEHSIFLPEEITPTYVPPIYQGTESNEEKDNDLRPPISTGYYHRNSDQRRLPLHAEQPGMATSNQTLPRLPDRGRDQRTTRPIPIMPA